MMGRLWDNVLENRMEWKSVGETLVSDYAGPTHAGANASNHLLNADLSTLEDQMALIALATSNPFVPMTKDPLQQHHRDKRVMDTSVLLQ